MKNPITRIFNTTNRLTMPMDTVTRIGVSLEPELLKAFDGDYTTQKLIQKWIDDEQEHIAWMAQYLNYIDKLGYENFLTAMM